MNREQMVKRAFQAMHQFTACGCVGDIAEHPMERHMAQEVVDAILPQVLTVEELEALAEGTKLIDEAGTIWWVRNRRRGSFPMYLRNDADHMDHPADARRLPLAVVWSPSTDQ